MRASVRAQAAGVDRGEQGVRLQLPHGQGERQGSARREVDAARQHREVEQLLEARLLALQVVGPLNRAGLEVDFKLLPSAKPIELAPVLTRQPA